MLQPRTIIKICDNSGAVKGRIIQVKGKGKLGDCAVISVQKNLPNSKIRKGLVTKCIIVRTTSKSKRFSSNLKWFDNSGVIVKLSPKGDEFLPIGSRIKGPISSDLKFKKGCLKVLSLSKTLI